MELQQPRQLVPTTMIEQRPESRVWPTTPTTTITTALASPTPVPAAAEVTLPNLRTILSAEFEPRSPSTLDRRQHGLPLSPTSSRSLPPIDVSHVSTYAAHHHLPESAAVSPMDTGSVMSREVSVASVEDMKERIAAEALAGLGNPDYARGSSKLHMPSHASPTGSARASDERTHPEPILELIQQVHPWVGGTIKGSLTAYSTTKYYSPRIVQYGATLVERNITTPMVSAVNSVGELTGAEHGLRRYLDSRRPEAARKEQDASMSMDLEQGPTYSSTDDRGDTFDPPTEALPAYRASRPPSYREAPSPTFHEGHSQVLKTRPSPAPARSLSSQILITTSGLTVALSTTSRNSLRYCLRLLGQSFQHVSNVTQALSMFLSQYEETRQRLRSNDGSALEKGGPRPRTPEQNLEARRLAEAIEQHCQEIWNSMRSITDLVSRTVGGALPENARQFVRQQLMSLPQRWQATSNQQTAESDTSRGAQRMIGFASEGLDMMTQVSTVLQGTLDSAERWLERVGRRDPDDQLMHDVPSHPAWRPETEKS